MKTLRVQGIYVGSRTMLAECMDTFAAHDIKPVIDQMFAFTNAKDAFHTLEHAQHFGKIVITFPAA